MATHSSFEQCRARTQRALASFILAIILNKACAFSSQSGISVHAEQKLKNGQFSTLNFHVQNSYPFAPSFSISSSKIGVISFSFYRKSLIRADTTLYLLKTPAGGKHYQLEELEDSDTATTDLILNNDNTVTLGKTDGPLFQKVGSGGTWSETFEDKRSEGGVDRRLLEMTLKRRYIGGSEDSKGSQATNIGEFEYEVERTFVGEVSLVGGTVLSVNGEIHDRDDVFGDRKVIFADVTSDYT